MQRRSDQFLGLKEALEVLHLPEASEEKDEGLCNRPPKHTLVCALAGLTETLLAILKQAFLSQCSPVMLKSVQIHTAFESFYPFNFQTTNKNYNKKTPTVYSILLFSNRNTHDKKIFKADVPVNYNNLLTEILL